MGIIYKPVRVKISLIGSDQEEFKENIQ